VGELVSMVSRAQRLHKEERSTTTTVGELGVNLASFFEAIVETRATSQRRIQERMSIPLPTSYDEDLSQSSLGSLSFHDFVGYSEIKNQIRRILKTIPTEAESALPPQRDKALAGIIAPMRGVVIHGPVGCGKTFLAKVSIHFYAAI
jgi:SpoVK/Ycf46/Vps4 family AAA+-type ATPase